MTMAICIKCGSRKIGAWTPCEVCGFRGVDLEDLAKAMYLTDHFHEPESLQSAARQIQDGTFSFDEQQLAPILKDLRKDPELPDRIRNLKTLEFRPVWIALRKLLMIGAMVWLLFLVWRTLTESWR